MPGYHKKYQGGTGAAANPTRRDPAGLRPQQYSQSEMGQLEDLKRQFAAAGGMETDQGKMIAARARAMQENIPLQEVYERYSDEFGEMGEKSLYPQPMRMVKQNLTGRQMNIAKQAAPKDEITGADFKKLREMLMGRGKANSKVYQGGTGDMEAAVAEVKKQNPDATTEEITNFLLNPEAGFQKGDIGRLGGTSGRPEQLPTFQDFFEKEYGYFPTVGTLPTTEQGAYRGSDLKGAPENVFYSDLTEKTSDEGLFRGSVDRGSGAFPTARGRYETVEDFRDYQPGSSFQGVSFFRSGAGDEELRGAYKTKKDVEEASKRYAELMRKAKLSPKKGVTMEAIDPEREGESGGFRVTGPASEVNKTMGEKLMRAGMYIR